MIWRWLEATAACHFKTPSTSQSGPTIIALPRFQRIIQTRVINAAAIPPAAIVDEVRGTLRKSFPPDSDSERLAVTPRIALGVGSRGIANIDLIVRATVDEFQARGYHVFIVPAMGSHGGSNADGQKATLAHYGITEHSMGVPIEASMDTVEVASHDGITVGCASVAWRPDTLLFPVNRIKAHTNILAKATQSGLRKMLLIGFGKRQYAQAFHAINGTSGLGPVIESGAKTMIATGRVLGGLAIVDGANHGTHLVEAIPAQDFATREPELLALADRLMPTFPVDRIGVLHLGQIGKAIAGSSADPNVMSLRLDGSRRVEGKGTTPIGIVCASKPHPDTDGNVIGIGRLDVVTQELADARGPATYENARSAGTMAGYEPKRIEANDRTMLSWAIQQVPQELPLVSIKDTLSLGELIVDEQTGRALAEDDQVDLHGSPFDADFDANGRITNFWRISH